jgi:predicted 3-demethylubiquinone-9 3-methyltransferase (glyoxalase superfamily)
MQKITPFLWFDDKAEEAATFYTSVLRIQRSQTLLVMEMQVQRSPENQREP